MGVIIGIVILLVVLGGAWSLLKTAGKYVGYTLLTLLAIGVGIWLIGLALRHWRIVLCLLGALVVLGLVGMAMQDKQRKAARNKVLAQGWLTEQELGISDDDRAHVVTADIAVIPALDKTVFYLSRPFYRALCQRLESAQAMTEDQVTQACVDLLPQFAVHNQDSLFAYMANRGDALGIQLSSGRVCCLSPGLTQAYKELLHRRGAATAEEFQAICAEYHAPAVLQGQSRAVAQAILENAVERREAEAIRLDAPPTTLYRSNEPHPDSMLIQEEIVLD